MSNAFSIPIPGERPLARSEPDPFPEPRCAFCGRVVLVGPGRSNYAVQRQALHDGFDGTLEQFYVARTRPGDKVLWTHRSCGMPERA